MALTQRLGPSCINYLLLNLYFMQKPPIKGTFHTAWFYLYNACVQLPPETVTLYICTGHNFTDIIQFAEAASDIIPLFASILLALQRRSKR